MGHSLCQTASGQLKAEVSRPAVVMHRHKCGGVVTGHVVFSECCGAGS